jgi:hypothetical protein
MDDTARRKITRQDYGRQRRRGTSRRTTGPSEPWGKAQFPAPRRRTTSSSSLGCNRHKLAMPAFPRRTKRKDGFDWRTSLVPRPSQTGTERGRDLPQNNLLHPPRRPSKSSTGLRRGRATGRETTSTTTRPVELNLNAFRTRNFQNTAHMTQKESEGPSTTITRWVNKTQA